MSTYRILTLLVLVGCKVSPEEVSFEVSDECTDDGEENCIEAVDDALLLSPDHDNDEGIEGFEMVSDSQFEVRGSDSALARFQVGTPILRAVPDYGLLVGRITDVEEMDGARRVEYERTSIEEVIPRARLRTRQRINCLPVSGPDGMTMQCEAEPVRASDRFGASRDAARAASEEVGSSSEELGVTDCSQSLLETRNVSLALDQCRFTVSFDAVFNWEWGFVKGLTMEAYLEMDTDSALELRATLSGSYHNENEIRLGGIGTTFFIGVIPFYVSGSIYVGYELNLSGEADFEVGYQYDDHRTFGFGYARGDGIYKISDADVDSSAIGPTYSLEADVNARAWFRPEVEFGVGVDNVLAAGATLGLEAGATFDGEVYVDNDEAEVCTDLSLYVSPTIGYDLDLFGTSGLSGTWNIADFSSSLFDECISTDEQELPDCRDSHECNSNADCALGSRIGNGVIAEGATVDGAPEGLIWRRDTACITPSCDSSACECAYEWIQNCCTIDPQCGLRGECNTATHRCEGIVEADAFVLAGDRANSSCSDDDDCADGNPTTTDECNAGSCSHTAEAGGACENCECASSDECGTAENGAVNFCAAGECLELVEFDRCLEGSCDDGIAITRDECSEGECSNEVMATSTVYVQPIEK